MVGLGALKGLFQPTGFYVSMIFNPKWSICGCFQALPVGYVTIQTGDRECVWCIYRDDGTYP